MRGFKKSYVCLVMALGLASGSAFAAEHGHGEHGGDGHGEASSELCTGFGPQTPRDIDSAEGDNTRAFSLSPDYRQMNLCNIHFHENAEHKAKDFSVFAGEGHDGYGSGYKANISSSLSKAELTPLDKPACKGEHGDLQPGDTIEVHWVHSSADVTPGKSLGACLSDNIKNPDLRVEAQVFVLVNDKNALNFNEMGYGGNVVNGFHQAKSIPADTGKPVLFAGSTTGPKYSEATCSPLQVTWSVRPKVAKLDINSVAKWCESNEFGEDHAHGVRKLVTSPKLLSKIAH
ncbi:MAG: delta-class carbonic anhydrase [Pseudomonadota bacterium]